MLDHLVYAAPDLEAAVEDLAERAGVRPAAGGRHEGLGTRNALLGLGAGRYLEIIAPDSSQAAPPSGRPFGIDALQAPRLVGWAARARGLATAVEAAGARGLELGPVIELHRAIPGGGVVQWSLALPRGAPEGGLAPFLIDWGDSPHPSESAPPGCTLDAFSGVHPDPVSVAQWLDALGAELEVAPGARPALRAVLSTPRGTIQLE